jgi:prevent-host-death family protein
MALIHDTAIISVTEANKKGVAGLVSAAERGEEIIIARHSKPIAGVVGIERLGRMQRLEEDLLDLALVTTRLLEDRGQRHSFEGVLDEFDLTREDLHTD